jgi:LPXTG-site transpeptidase (sortase) family protein
MSKTIKILLIGFFLACIVGVGWYLLSLPGFIAPKVPVATTLDAEFGWKFPTASVKFPSTGSAAGGDLAYSSLPDPGGIPSGLPITLQIPAIGVNSAIEDALITPDGRMDVPAGTTDVAWFALGPQPGSIGSAVIGGHYGIQNGIPFVFYNLDKLKVGDMIYTTNDEGITFTFIVRSIASYNRNADASSVFTSSDGLAHLNLITCEGIWNAVNGSYPDRLVIFSDLVPAGSSIPASTITSAASTSLGNTSSSAATAATFSTPLRVGSTGTDVIALQTFLEQRGLLELPPGVVNGRFGPLTSAALAEYQTTVGLPGVGVLGPLTMGKINAELASRPILPNTGLTGLAGTTIGTQEISSSSNTTAVTAASSLTFYQALVQFIKNLYATPFDGLITTLLLALVGFVVFRIVRVLVK